MKRGSRQPLSETELAAALEDLPGWAEREGHLERTFRFESFVRAFGFMTACALEAEKLDHHPDWSNSYCEVVVRLRTHDAKALTGLDIELARRMSALAN